MNRTHKKLDRLFVVAVVALVSAFTARTAAAQILATTARQSSSGSLKFLAYYQGVQDQTLNFNVNNGGGNCSTKNGLSFACGQAGSVDSKGSGGAAMLKVVWQPWERFQYYAMLGGGDYSLSVASPAYSNVLTGDKHGLIYGAGLKASIVPDTIVAAEGLPSPAISLDASLARSLYDFNRVYPANPGGSDSISQRLELMTYQFAVEASHLFSVDERVKLEPYGGVKWTRVQSDLKDLVSGSHAGGAQDTVTPFLGLRVPVEDHEALFAEASFVDGYHYGAGLELRFK